MTLLRRLTNNAKLKYILFVRKLAPWRELFEPKWSSLSLFGNSNIAKLTMLSPIVAQAVKYSDDFLITNLGLFNVLWLYWSLMLIALGQLIYTLRAPSEIKKYGPDTELFKIEVSQTYTTEELERLNLGYIKSNYINIRSYYRSLKYKGGFDKPLNILSNLDRSIYKEYESQELREILERDKAENISDTRKWTNNPKDELYKLSIDDIVSTIRDYYIVLNMGLYNKSLNWRIVGLVSASRGELLGQRGNNIAPVRDRAFGTKLDWQMPAIDWYYERLDELRAKERWVVLLLYIVGGTYFLVNILRNIIHMSGLSFSWVV